jgi:hypothetical protein
MGFIERLQKLIINIADNKPNYLEISKLVTSINDRSVVIDETFFKDIRFADLRGLFLKKSRSIIPIAEPPALPELIFSFQDRSLKCFF